MLQIRLVNKSTSRIWSIATTSCIGFSCAWLLGISETLAQYSGEVMVDDFNFWAEQCQTLAQRYQYDKALAACDEAIAQNSNLEETLGIWVTRGEALMYLGQNEEALTAFGLVLELEPEYSLAMTYRCRVQYILYLFEDAVDTCEEALLIDGNWGQRSPALAWYYRGLALQKQGFLETALDSFGRGVRSGQAGLISEEEMPTALNESIESTQENEDILSSLPSTEPPLVIEVALAEAEWCHTLHLLGRTGQSLAIEPLADCGIDVAIYLIEEVLATTPQDSILWERQGFVLEQIGQYERALAAYERSLALLPDNAEALTRKCGVLNQLAQYEAALEACDAALRAVQPQSASQAAYRFNQKSIALLGLEQYEEAIALAEQAIAVTPDYAPAYNSLSVGLWQLGEIPAAYEIVRIALENYQEQEILFADTFYRPNVEPWPLFYRDYGLAHYNAGRIASEYIPQNFAAIDEAYSQSLTTPIGGLAQHSTVASRWNHLPVNVIGITDNEQLVLRLSNSVSRGQILPMLPPDRFLNTLHNLSAIYLDEFPSKAFTFAAEAARLDPESEIAWHNIGLAAIRSGQLEEAFYIYSLLHHQEPENLSVLMNLGSILAVQGRNEEAIAIYQQILNIDATYTPAQERLTALEESVRANQMD